ncbi:MAG: hypothetical protein PF489_07075 [Salinivirgaceae bacterium]|jgi:hypothetical protein|nr:hypothetical protein [Salinivirgaceae bacterium]
MRKLIQNGIAVAAALLLTVGCSETDIEYIFPKDYLPAYPESYWIYSDGTTTKVSPGYRKHRYFDELESTERSDEVYVPYMAPHYVYGYKVTQNDNRYPLKKLLSEVNGETWKIGDWLNGTVHRKVIDKDVALTLSSPILNTEEQVFDSVIVVIEYIKETDTTYPWKLKEYYAPFVGLIRQDIRRNNDSLIAKELVRYYIAEKN